MKKTKSSNKIIRLFKLAYIKLFRINDSPQKIACGIGLGIFSGILPGTGPLAALSLAFIFRANRASALIGSLLTNTWLSFVTFLLAIKTGSAILGMNWQEARQGWDYFLKTFHWPSLFKATILKVILPILLGYLVIGSCLGILAYSLTLIIINKVRK
jgi:uncharacterized protein